MAKYTLSIFETTSPSLPFAISLNRHHASVWAFLLIAKNKYQDGVFWHVLPCYI